MTTETDSSEIFGGNLSSDGWKINLILLFYVVLALLVRTVVSRRRRNPWSLVKSNKIVKMRFEKSARRVVEIHAARSN